MKEFLSGREFHVNVIEDGPDTAVPLCCPSPKSPTASTAPDWWPVYTYTAKWDEQSQEYKDCPLLVPVELEPEPTTRLPMAARAFRLFQCRDFARIDVRMNSAGEFAVPGDEPEPLPH